MISLTDSDLAYIRKLLTQYPAIEQAILFGSRAKGTSKHGSDVDIALKGANLGMTVTRLGGILNDESPLPYYFDLLEYSAITNNDLKHHIDRVGKIIYERTL